VCRRPCITCGRPALCVNDHEKPQHKVCAEAELDAAEAQTTTRYYETRHP
jgi:hypothetical protein